MVHDESNEISRRNFMRAVSTVAGVTALGLPQVNAEPADAAGSGPAGAADPITIDRVDSTFEREALVRPLGFKGGYLTNLWQAVALMESDSGHRGIGLGTQSVLWSDADVFANHSESGGNALMYVVTERALQMVEGMSFTTPIDLQEKILEEVYAYGREVAADPELRETFVMNALVAVDNAAWLVYAREHGIEDFDEMIPEPYRPALSHQHEKVASVPTMGYTVPVEEVRQTAEQGYYIFKIKIGHPGTQEEMLEKDKAHMTAIHEAIGEMETPYTASGKPQYYIDANGRYEAKETVARFIDHLKDIGAFEQTLVIEEPFPEELHVSVDDLEVNIAADESAHTDEDVAERIEMGYGSIALKPIAKTLSMTLKMAQLAHEEDMPCFCADLTVNPILVDWNKSVAARLAPFPGLDTGMMETNGHQNYADWETMQSYHPRAGAPWTQVTNGAFELDNGFYEDNAGILTPSAHYQQLFQTG
jgi:L-alanine-DL-glutamate epimerase-like enolase superfamily enzyme